MSLVTFNTVRYYTDADVYHYTVDNRPLQDLASNDVLLQSAIDILAAATSGGGVTAQDFFSGTHFTAGTTTALTLSSTPASASGLWVFFDGVYQNVTTYTLNSATITFGSAIPLGVTSVEVKWANGGTLNSYSTTTVTTQGDADLTLPIARDAVVNYTAPLTANRTVFLPSGATQGFRTRVVRSAASTGAFAVTTSFGGSGIKILNTAGTWADFIYNGTTWIQTAAGSL